MDKFFGILKRVQRNSSIMPPFVSRFITIHQPHDYSHVLHLHHLKLNNHSERRVLANLNFLNKL
ncbi:hypothetical protein FWK35_00028808 [Aphis craccivora]|uniref:Uncharacterized protein n=1 Tax=Aphis craccivora TaxID=307492 RepID=A0A6G0Y4U8_APHCR|nr:hypothetical protein FWK35_00028808 [Aphis craccivora]